jgi:hypothetical protein
MTLALALLLAQAVYSAGPAPCSLVTRADVDRVLHWSAPSGHESAYRLPQSSGARCTYDNDLVEPFRNGLGTRVPGIGDSAQMFDNTMYPSKHGSSVSIAVLTTNGETSVTSLTALAHIAARRMP